MPPALQTADLSAYLARPSAALQELQRLFGRNTPKVIFDIGACEGEDSVRFARAYPLAKIFAFEPLPANQALIRVNLARYGILNTELVTVALSDRPGTATFHVSSGQPKELHSGDKWNYGNKSSSLLAPAQDTPMHGWIEFKETIGVTTDTLDRFCAAIGLTHIDFIQMDVQGAEQYVLNGATAMLPRIAAIWLEVSAREHYKGQALAADIRHFMWRHGFILAHKVYLGDATGEGDHYYLNLRHPRTWIYLATKWGRAFACRLMRMLHS